MPGSKKKKTLDYPFGGPLGSVVTDPSQQMGDGTCSFVFVYDDDVFTDEKMSGAIAAFKAYLES